MGVTGFAVSASNTVGGVTPGAGNVIAFNRLDGVHIDDGTNHLVRGNSIFSNGQLGIDLGTQEIGPLNDPGDLDKGANDFQNHPVLTAATNRFTALYLSGTLNSRTMRTYILDFFGNQQCDTSGRGEGEAYLGSLQLDTDASGNATFSTTFPINRQPLQWLTATATDSFGNTSEFSPCLPIALAPPTLNVTASSGHIQLQWPRSTPTNFALETTTNLSTAIWQSVTGQINTDGDFRTFGFNIDPSEAARFFRLRSSQ